MKFQENLCFNSREATVQLADDNNRVTPQILETKLLGFRLTTRDLTLVEVFTNHILVENTYITNHIE